MGDERKLREELRNLFMRENKWNGAHFDTLAYRLADKVLATLQAAILEKDAEIARIQKELSDWKFWSAPGQMNGR